MGTTRVVQYDWSQEGCTHFVCQDCRRISPIGARMTDKPQSLAREPRGFYCYPCVMRHVRTIMIETGRADFYFSEGENGEHPHIHDWYGETLFKVHEIFRYRHPFTRIPATMGRFRGPDGKVWAFRNIGDNDIARCRRVAEPRKRSKAA